MSAGSPRRSHSQTRTPHGTATVSPQQVTDPSILDSVAGFINEVATYNIPFDTKDQIQWAKFQQLDRERISENVLDGEKVIPSALILILGYSTGIQVWAIPANGEAVELLSWRHGSVKVLQFLPQPCIGKRSQEQDMFVAKRPLMALCDATTPGPQHCALNFLSLKTGEQSYTATVLHAAKSLGKGLRELGETVANSLTGNPTFKPGNLPGNTLITGNNGTDVLQKGVITILDIENPIIENRNIQCESVVAHFAAHTEAIVYLAFDPSGLLLLTADKRGHDFHLFRIHPHPGGPALAAVHHLYILHRGDTTARVQDMCFSPDSRWAAVSTLRGTTHVFPITPYGGNVGVRTHATPHVVNRMSRFHRSAGLPVEGRSNSPVSLFEAPINSNIPFNNPRLPPFPYPTIVHPLAQIRQPLFIPPGGNLQSRPHTGRPRLNSSSEDNIHIAIRLSCCFAPARAWFDNTTKLHDTTTAKQQTKSVESLFVMSCHGTLLQYDLDPHHVASIPKEKVCDETPIELTVHAKAQWNLQRQLHLNDVPLPISPRNLNLLPPNVSIYKSAKPNHDDDRWLSQVEIVTHAGPHRRLWMGPQFTFKTYTTTNGTLLSLNEVQAIDVNRSKPVNMPMSTAYPILIESGSASSCEQSPKLLDTYQQLSEETGGPGELQLKEDLADAMLESPGVRESGGRCVIVSMKPHTTSVAKVVNPLGTVVTVHSDEDGIAEVVEDVVIHENCDEALFRPVVAPPPYNKSKKSNQIISTKPLVETTKKLELQNQKPDVNPNPAKSKTETIAKVTKTKLEIKDIEPTKPSEALVTKKPKLKAKSNAEKPAEKEKPADANLTISLNTCNGTAQDISPLNNLITTPDLMDAIPTFSFPISLKNKNDDNNEHERYTFTPLFKKTEKDKKCEEIKIKKFEDEKFENPTNELVSTLTIEPQKEVSTHKVAKSNCLESEEVILSSEEEKTAAKKVRKPKAKLGVRLNKGKDFEKETSPTIEVSLPLPKKTWSSVVSTKPVEIPPEIYDMPELECEPCEMPKRSYSTAAKQHLLEIDPNEDCNMTDLLIPEKIYVETQDLKNDTKSDDENKENGGSQNETTESDDSAKVIAMDTEEDNCQAEVTKGNQPADKNVKKKSKKKKR
ncbi:hypothetical protein FQR65_LT05326 [Abscondita terminalis]|nr:hypothetical protein FQR65_LT05326 [Abscondita terminalis]